MVGKESFSWSVSPWREMPLTGCFFEQSGSIEGSVLKQFYTNLVLLPLVMEYLQYILLGLSVPLIVSAALLMARRKVRPCRCLLGSAVSQIRLNQRM